MRATNFLRQLRHPVPPPQQEMVCMTQIFWGLLQYWNRSPFPLSVVLGEIKFVGKTPSRSECRIGTPLAAAALNPGLLKRGKEVDINHFHVSLAHAHASVLKAIAKQHGIRLTGKMASCSACSRAKAYRAPTPHDATRRAKQPLGLVHIDTAGPYPTYLGGSLYVVMFVEALHAYSGRTARAQKRAPPLFSV